MSGRHRECWCCSAVAATLCLLQTVVEADNIDIVIVKRWKDTMKDHIVGFFCEGNISLILPIATIGENLTANFFPVYPSNFLCTSKFYQQ